MNQVYALCGTIFFGVFVVSIIVFGDETARNIAILSAFFGGLSQFLAQDGRRSVSLASIIVAYVSMITALAAYIVMIN